jgi:hypothetical protein
MSFFPLRVKDQFSHPFKTAFNLLYSEILHNIRWIRLESLVKNGLSLSSRRGGLNSIENNFSSVAGHPHLSPAPDHEFASRMYNANANKHETSLLQISPIYTSVLSCIIVIATLGRACVMKFSLVGQRRQERLPLYSLLALRVFTSRSSSESMYTERPSFRNVFNICSVPAILYLAISFIRSHGSVVGSGTMVQAERSRVRVPMRWMYIRHLYVI